MTMRLRWVAVIAAMLVGSAIGGNTKSTFTVEQVYHEYGSSVLLLTDHETHTRCYLFAAPTGAGIACVGRLINGTTVSHDESAPMITIPSHVQAIQ